MSDWNFIYKKHGIVQKEPIPAVLELSKRLSHNKNLQILDSGCGTGRHVFFLADEFNNAKIEALDVSSEAIDKINNLIEKYDIFNVKTKVHNLDDGLPYEDNLFDAIISSLVIEHGLIKQIKIWCHDMDRVLKKGGFLVVAVPSVNDPRFLTGEEIEERTKINTKQLDGEIPHHFFTDKEIESLFLGYKVIYKKLQSRPSVTADVIAQHWEYVLQK